MIAKGKLYWMQCWLAKSSHNQPSKFEEKSDILKGGGVGMELKQLHRADVSSYSSCQAQYRVSFTTLPLLSTIHRVEIFITKKIQ